MGNGESRSHVEELVWEEEKLPTDGSDLKSLASARLEVARYRELVAQWGSYALTHPKGIVEVRKNAPSISNSLAPNASNAIFANHKCY
jgi:hypothetical protein